MQSGLNIGANIYDVYVSVGFQGGYCNGLLNEMGGEVPCFITLSRSLQNVQSDAWTPKTLRSFRLSPEDTARGSMVEDFVAVVRGGSSESITALVSKKLPTPQLMGLWGDSVRFNPDFIRTTVSLSFSHWISFFFVLHAIVPLVMLSCLCSCLPPACLFFFFLCVSTSQFRDIIKLSSKDLTWLMDAETFTKELVSSGAGIWQNYRQTKYS